jgi:hypothetical protein
MLGFIRRLSFEFRDPYTLKSFYTSLVRSKLEYASCVWRPFYDVRVDKVEREQRRLIRYALRRMNSQNLLSTLDLNTPRYRTRGFEFFRIGFMNRCLPQFAGLTGLLGYESPEANSVDLPNSSSSAG